MVICLHWQKWSHATLYEKYWLFYTAITNIPQQCWPHPTPYLSFGFFWSQDGGICKILSKIEFANICSAKWDEVQFANFHSASCRLDFECVSTTFHGKLGSVICSLEINRFCCKFLQARSSVWHQPVEKHFTFLYHCDCWNGRGTIPFCIGSPTTVPRVKSYTGNEVNKFWWLIYLDNVLYYNNISFSWTEWQKFTIFSFHAHDNSFRFLGCHHL